MMACANTHDERVLMAGAVSNSVSTIIDCWRTYKAQSWMDKNLMLEQFVENGRTERLGNRIVSVQRVERRLIDYRVTCVVATWQGTSYSRSFAFARSFKDSAELADIFSNMVQPQVFSKR